MINLLIKELKSFAEIKDYRILRNKEDRSEIYYIGDKVETLRNASLSATLNVTIYCDYENERGSANFVVFDSYSEEEIKEKIKDAINRAKFSKNTYFDLPKGDKKVFGSKLDKIDNNIPFKIGETIIEASKGYIDGWVSSFEVFIKQREINLVNSKGIDYTYFTNSVFLEIIPTFKKENLEIELYNALDYDDVDLEQIKKDVINLMKNANLRNNSVKYTGPSNIPVILEAQEIKEIFSNLLGNFSYSSEYNHMNLLKVNDKFYGEEFVDAPNINLVPTVKGKLRGRPFDNDGIILKDTPIVKDNIIVNTHGDNRFGYYLGVKEPTGILPIINIADGKYSEKELHAQPYLNCLAFSSFQFDIFSGNFGGEVRLALYFDGEKEIPVSGLTIGGNIHELKSHLKFSNERKNIDGYSGPKHVLIDSMNAN